MYFFPVATKFFYHPEPVANKGTNPNHHHRWGEGGNQESVVKPGQVAQLVMTISTTPIWSALSCLVPKIQRAGVRYWLRGSGGGMVVESGVEANGRST